jgi:hypothetical protein
MRAKFPAHPLIFDVVILIISVEDVFIYFLQFNAFRYFSLARL